jgi:hypothetical protein
MPRPESRRQNPATTSVTRFSEGRGTDPAQDDNVEANTMTMTTAPILAMLAANGLPEACGGLPAADVRLGTTS